MLKSFIISSVMLILLCPLAQAKTSRAPVFGYLERPQSFVVTLNGKPALQFPNQRNILKSPPRPELIQFVRNLNQMAQSPHYSPQKIQPVLKGSSYQIHYGNRVLLKFKSQKSKQRKVKNARLSALMKLTQNLRVQLGAPKQDVFQHLGASSADQTGMASWYGGYFHGRLTANGERYDIALMTAAHKRLPFGTRVLVTNLETGRSVVVKINDRGPFKPRRIIDLSPTAFKKIGYLGQGVLKVKLTILNP